MPVSEHIGGGPTGPPPGAGVEIAVSMRGLAKRYGGVQALAGVDLDVAAGTVHAVLGENGAGKSTLMKILAGAVRPDAGTITVAGEPYEAVTPHAARARGIGIVYQELSLFPNRSVLANLFANREPTRRGFLSRRAMIERALPVLREIGLDVDVDTQVGFLPIAEQQLVELSRVVLLRPSLLILDEPNSALSEGETERLFGVLRRLAASGITMLYVSHRLEEVFQIADRVTVLRNGHHILTEDRADLTLTRVVEAMIGRHEEELYPPRVAREPDSVQRALSVRGISVRGRLEDVSFEAQSGEIVGLAGIEGSGVSELLGVLFGVTRASAGSATFPDGRGLPHSPNASARRRISMIPADRRRGGLMLDKSVQQNVGQVSIGALPGSPWLSARDLLDAARRQIRDLQITTSSAAAAVHELSGGNQQKVVIGKWLEIAPHVVLLDDPARGVDVGAKREIFTIVRKLSAEGLIVLLRSTELPELIGLCDRILVFRRGRLVDDRPASDFDSASLLHAVNTAVTHTTEEPP